MSEIQEKKSELDEQLDQLKEWTTVFGDGDKENGNKAKAEVKSNDIKVNGGEGNEENQDSSLDFNNNEKADDQEFVTLADIQGTERQKDENAKGGTAPQNKFWGMEDYLQKDLPSTIWREETEAPVPAAENAYEPYNPQQPLIQRRGRRDVVSPLVLEAAGKQVYIPRAQQHQRWDNNNSRDSSVSRRTSQSSVSSAIETKQTITYEATPIPSGHWGADAPIENRQLQQHYGANEVGNDLSRMLNFMSAPTSRVASPRMEQHGYPPMTAGGYDPRYPQALPPMPEGPWQNVNQPGTWIEPQWVNPVGNEFGPVNIPPKSRSQSYSSSAPASTAVSRTGSPLPNGLIYDDQNGVFSKEELEQLGETNGRPVFFSSQTTPATLRASMERRKPGNGASFVCPYCGQTFTRMHNLKGHIRRHNDFRPFKCKVPGCNKDFARQHDLKRHRIQTHGEKSK